MPLPGDWNTAISKNTLATIRPILNYLREENPVPGFANVIHGLPLEIHTNIKGFQGRRGEFVIYQWPGLWLGLMGISSLESFTYPINSFYFLVTWIAQGSAYLLTTNAEEEKILFWWRWSENLLVLFTPSFYIWAGRHAECKVLCLTGKRSGDCSLLPIPCTLTAQPAPRATLVFLIL